MKTSIIITSLTLTTLFSCKRDQTILSELKSPVVIIGINNIGTIVSMKDSTGRIEVFSDTGLAYSLCDSRKVGDAIK